MDKNGYLSELYADGREWIEENVEYYDSFDDAYFDMELTITGNDNGSYYCNSYKAREALEGVLWDDDVVDAIRDMGFDGMPTDRGPETCDVLVRIALLGELYSKLEDYFDELKEEQEEEEEDE